MNERIKELAEQAYVHARQYIDDKTQIEFEKKFAELIVKECVTRLEQHHPFTKDPEAYLYAISLIEEHFGVESDDDEYDDEVEYCPKCNEGWSGTSCGIDDCGWIVGEEV
jgi:hypothetical protein